MITIYLKGLALGASLIIAIGAQNAFVLSQGIRKKYTFIIPLVCSLIDGILISMGVLGMGQIVTTHPSLSKLTAIAGALFLLWYGVKSFKSFLDTKTLKDSIPGPDSLKSAVGLTLAVSLLNPHVYLDTIFLLGGISSQFEGNGRFLFGAGAVTASFLWFFSLSLGGRILSPIFKKPIAWKILDLLITICLWSIAFSLIKNAFF